jgi:hypothetical protein
VELEHEDEAAGRSLLHRHRLCCVELLLAAAAWLLLTAVLDAGAVVQVCCVTVCNQQVSKTGSQQPCRCRSASVGVVRLYVLVWVVAWCVCVTV